MPDTIVALSSGALPSAIAVVRISGPDAFAAARSVAGGLPPLREARVRRLRHDAGTIDRALTICFAGPDTATGEDLVEFHTHGSIAVVDALLGALCAQGGVRHAEPGEFTRRSLENGRTDLVEVEGLAALLAAETEAQRRVAMGAMEGLVRARLDEVEREILTIAARIELMLDFADEEDGAAADLSSLRNAVRNLAGDLERWLAEPTADAVHRGFKVVLAGEPNVGKSSLLNRMAGREAAIVTDIAGTTRDRIEVPVRYDGLAFVLVDTAGLTSRSDDPVERIGVERAHRAIEDGDVVLWLGQGEPGRQDAILVRSKLDTIGREAIEPNRIGVSAHSGDGVDRVWKAIVDAVSDKVPMAQATVLNDRQNRSLKAVAQALRVSERSDDPVLIAHQLASARHALHRVTGSADVEALLDNLFGRFCIGK